METQNKTVKIKLSLILI